MLSKIIELKYRNIQSIKISRTSKVYFPGILYRRDCKLDIDDHSIVEGNLIFERSGASIRIGSNTFLGNKTSLVCSDSIHIGDNVLISWGCTLIDHDAHALRWEKRLDDVSEWFQGRKDWNHVNHRPIVVHDKAWIGFNSILLKGVTIGEGAVVGAGSVVTRDVAPYTLVAGNPAKFIKDIRGE